ncbi:DUF5366 family protein [Bacillus tianshenii]|nr:DUF5366 family protein [Bacillus tianshenii]
MPGVKNLYYTSYFPFLSILLFSAAFAVSLEKKLVALLQEIGIYHALSEFFSAGNIELLLFGSFVLCFVMLLSALKVLADMMLQFSCLFFADDKQEEHDQRMKEGRFLFLAGGVLSLLFSQLFWLLSVIFLLTGLSYFVFITYRMSNHFTTSGLVGFVFFQMLFWLSFMLGFGFLLLRTYRYVLESLPV